MEMTTKQKLEAAIVDNCSPRTILAYLKFRQSEAEQNLRMQVEQSQYRFTQGCLHEIDPLINLLNKVVS